MSMQEHQRSQHSVLNLGEHLDAQRARGLDNSKLVNVWDGVHVNNENLEDDSKLVNVWDGVHVNTENLDVDLATKESCSSTANNTPHDNSRGVQVDQDDFDTNGRPRFTSMKTFAEESDRRAQEQDC